MLIDPTNLKRHLDILNVLCMNQLKKWDTNQFWWWVPCFIAQPRKKSNPVHCVETILMNNLPMIALHEFHVNRVLCGKNSYLVINHDFPFNDTGGQTEKNWAGDSTNFILIHQTSFSRYLQRFVTCLFQIDHSAPFCYSTFYSNKYLKWEKKWKDFLSSVCSLPQLFHLLIHEDYLEWEVLTDCDRMDAHTLRNLVQEVLPARKKLNHAK